MQDVILKHNLSTVEDILLHFKSCDPEFISELSGRTNLEDYANKLFQKAFRYEAWLNNKLVGLVAVYSNDEGFDFITNVSVSKEFANRGIASALLRDCIARTGNSEIRLEVSKENTAALRLYNKLGFICTKQDEKSSYQILKIS